MTPFTRAIFLVLIAGISSVPLFSSPLLPDSALGTGKTVEITNDRLILVLNGGRYNGTVDGFDVDLWCVDVERFASKGQTYMANVVPLLPWTPEQAALVRKGGLASEDFYWSDLGLGAVERYQAAAWLITQMEAYKHGASVTSDLHIQQAIWAILDDAEFQSIDPSPLAVAWMRTAAVVIRENPDFGLGQWAVVSGNAAPDGAFTGWEYQSFLTRLEQVSPSLRAPAPDAGPDGVHSPEPGTFFLAAAGLILAGLALRRRRG